MAEFEDTFADTTGTLLVNHTPDTGTGWTEEFNDTGQTWQVRVNTAKFQTGANNLGAVVSAQPDPTVVEYDVEATVVTNDSSLDDTFGLMARMGATAQDDNYNTRGSGNATTKIEIRKVVSGSVTVLNTTSAGYVDAKVYKFQIRDATDKADTNTRSCV